MLTRAVVTLAHVCNEYRFTFTRQEYWWNIGGILVLDGTSFLVLTRALSRLYVFVMNTVLHLPDKNIGAILVLDRTFFSSVDACRCHACTCL